ncbi:MAG: hypothetical protein ACYCSH_01105, partial [Acidithiobacillus sp.]
ASSTINFNGVQLVSQNAYWSVPDFGPATAYSGTPAWTSANIPVVVNGNSAYIPVSYTPPWPVGASSTINFNGVQLVSQNAYWSVPDFGPATAYSGTPAWTSANIPLVCQP